MRRDVFLDNDSGGLSVVAVDTVDAIIEDGRSNDEQFVAARKALLLELCGDDAVPVRVVVDEPLHPEEEAQWLARASWHLDTADGRLLVLGGFDPDVLSQWKDDTAAATDGRGVALVEGPPGLVKVDVYAHTGSMNGRQILSEADDKPGAAFRRDHPGRAWPLWLARYLAYSGDDDPGHEGIWNDVEASLAGGALEVDVDGPAVIGFLVHVTRVAGVSGTPPAGGWFGPDINARVPRAFPIGLASGVPDPGIEAFRDRLTGREPEPVTIPTTVAEIIDVWDGAPLEAVQPLPQIELTLAEAYALYWMAAFTSDSTPRFELRVTAKHPWTRPESSPELAVVERNASVTVIGPPAGAGGWTVWWAARAAAATLSTVPDGSTIDLAMAPRGEHDATSSENGRALYSGTVAAGKWRLEEASPAVDRATLEDALTFVRSVASEATVRVRGAAERAAFDRAVESYVFEEDSVRWTGDGARLAEPDERSTLLLAQNVFRTRFATQWPCDPVEE